MFPAGAGMNRGTAYLYMMVADVPRRRGDEPLPGMPGTVQGVCSPQARG